MSFVSFAVNVLSSDKPPEGTFGVGVFRQSWQTGESTSQQTSDDQRRNPP